MRRAILMRSAFAEQDELLAAKRHFDVIERRTQIQRGSLVIPRYSLLPFAAELHADVECMGGQLINTLAQHQYVADLQAWYDDFADVTPATWFHALDVEGQGPFVIKGATNGRKHLWCTHMFAPTSRDILTVLCRLRADSSLSDQQIYVRQYVELETFPGVLPLVYKLPVTQEWRFFLLDGEVLAYGFYWPEHYDEITTDLGIDLAPAGVAALAFVQETIGPRLKDKVRFVVADVARDRDGRWLLVELNDGCMSGLSMVDPNTLYAALARGLAC